MKKLIINADDFGLHRAVNQAVIRGYHTGCITSTSLIPSGAAFDDAVALCQANPDLGVGVHLTLVGEKPVSELNDVDSLLDKNGVFLPSKVEFLSQFIRGKIHLAEIRRELNLQVKKVITACPKVTHLDSHQHLHVLPGIIDIVIELAREYNIKAVRIPDESFFFLGQPNGRQWARILARDGLTVFARLAKKKVGQYGLQTANHFFGMLAGGNMSEENLSAIIRALPTGISEIMIHPGEDNKILQECYPWNYHWQDELAAVCSTTIRTLLHAEDIRLMSFGELSNG